MIDLKMIKERISCIDYCQANGIPIKQAGGRCVSPLRSGAKNKTSFICFEDWWYDYGSSQGGDVIDLAALLNHNGDKGSAIRELAKKAGVEDDTSSVGWVDYTQKLNNRIAYWHRNLSPEFRKYCTDRGITDETIDRLRIGQTDNGRLCIPYYKNGYVAYYITRYMEGGAFPDSKYMKQKKEDYCENIPWGLDTLNREGDTLVIAEGMFDVLSFYQEQYPCLSAITGHFPAAQLPEVLRAAKTFKRVFLVYDNDGAGKTKGGAGEKFTQKMAKILFAQNIPFIVGSVPRGYKDVSEYYQDGGVLQDLIDSAQEGVEALCEMIDDEKEFEQVIRKTCRYLTKTDVALLFSKIAKMDKFDESWLKTLKQECSSAPSDDAIVKELTEKHNLKFHGTRGFVEYNGKYWEAMDDNSIKSYIGDALGVYRTGNKLNSILNVLRAEVNDAELEEMNCHPVMNFINGTLELEPEIRFREHRAEDLCTYCLNYPYDPDAKSVVWENYLQTTTDYDDKKISLMQEWAGYPLFTDCSLHKAFALVGEGRNGKSIYVNAIRDIYGASNVSSVSMTDLTKDFHSIKLKYSMINMATETRSDVTGAEENFKKATVGETITDSFKGKDRIDFEPRAKWFLNCNNFMVSKTDQSAGWIERFCFCEFKMHFTEEPKLPNDRPIDRTLESKLKETEALSAIFNWALEGYKVLKATMKFTEPDDQEQTREDFIEVTNPLVVFAKEFRINECAGYSITNDDLYRNYVSWCSECNHKAMTRTNFGQKVPKIFQKYRTDLERYRSSSSRGWRLKEEEQTYELL